MFPQNHKQWAIFQILLMFWMFCSSSILNGQSPEIRAPEPVPSPYRQPSIRKFPFKHAKAADVLNILQQLAGQTDHIGLKIAVDERTNSLVFQPDDDRQSREFEETCALLDTETPSASVTGNGVPITIPSLGPKPLAFDFSIGIVRDETVESLKHRYNELEQQAHQLADKLKTSKSLSEAQRSELQLAVHKSFEARQALQRAELADLAQRMKSMQQSIAMRDKLADKVVQRRVEDLLNLDLKWEVTQANNSSTQAIPKRGFGSQATITSAKEMQALLQGTWDVRTFQTDNEGVGKQTYQAVIRGEVLLLELVENGHVLGASPWKLVWPNTEMPFEVEVTWDPNSQTETTPGMPGRIAYDGKSFQLAFGEKRPSEICPGEEIVYIDCTRATGVISIARESTLSTLDSSLNESTRSANLNDSTSNPKSVVDESMKQKVQGRWVIESLSDGLKEGLDSFKGLELRIEGELMTYASSTIDMQWRGPSERNNSGGKIYEIDFVYDPNGERIVALGILSSDGDRLQICCSTDGFSGGFNGGWRPNRFMQGSRVSLIECRRAPASATSRTVPGEADLSTPQATLDTIHRYSIAHPGDFPVECYYDEALLELSGMMLQNLSMMSAMSQIASQTGGVISEKDGVPVVSSMSPAFHIQVEALLKEHIWTTPLESANQAFELLSKLTFGSKSSNAVSLVHADRKLIRLAAGVLKAPKEFLPAASKLLTAYGENDADVTKSKEAAQTQPKADIAINGDEATATFISSGETSPSPLTAPRVTKMRRINGRWLISEILTDEEISQMHSSMSSVMDLFGGATEVKSDKSTRMSQPSTSPPLTFDTPQALLARLDECSKTGSYEEFVATFTNEGVRDVAGSLVISALQLIRSIEYGKHQGKDVSTSTETETALRAVLARWLPENATAEPIRILAGVEQKAVNEAFGIGDAPTVESAMQTIVKAIHKSAEAISDHRKFAIEMMQAFEKRNSKPFVYFGESDKKSEWQVVQFGDRAQGILIDGTEPSTKVTLHRVEGTWRISGLFNELLTEAEATQLVSNTTVPEQSNSKMITRRYSVGSFVTERFFTAKGSYDLKDVYEKYETEIEHSLQDLAKTVTAACTKPPKFVQVLSSSRCLLIGQTKAGHQEIADFMSDIGINNDRIRLRVKGGDITSDEAKALGIELTLVQRIIAPKMTDKLLQIANVDAEERKLAEENDVMLNDVQLDVTIVSGTSTPFDQARMIPHAITARFVPGTQQIQIRLDMRGHSDEKERVFMPRFQTLTDQCSSR